MGNAAGRPLINAVGKPRVLINGTCLDYLAESFMAGDPLNGGGFVILNGLEFDHEGQVKAQIHSLPGLQPFLPCFRRSDLRERSPSGSLTRSSSTGGKSSRWKKKTGSSSCLISRKTRGFSESELKKTSQGERTKARSPFEVYRKVRPKSAP
jgi:hypothetical protein